MNIRDHYYKIDGIPPGESGFWFLRCKMSSQLMAEANQFTRTVLVTATMDTNLIYSMDGIPGRVYCEEILREKGSGFWLPFVKDAIEERFQALMRIQPCDVCVVIPDTLLMAEDTEAIDLHAGYQVDAALRSSGILSRVGCSLNELVGDTFQYAERVKNDFLDGRVFSLPQSADIRTRNVLNFIIPKWHTQPVYYTKSTRIRVEEGSLIIPGTLEDPFENQADPGGCLSQAVAFGALPAPWCLLRTNPTMLSQQCNTKYTFVSRVDGSPCVHPVGVQLPLPEGGESFLQKVELLASLLVGGRVHEACVPV